MAIRSRALVAASLVMALTLTACGRPVTTMATNATAATLAAKAAGNTPIGQSLMTSFDRNRDGELSGDEVAGSWLQDESAAIDANHDGKLVASELDGYFQQTGKAASPAAMTAEGIPGGIIGGGAAALIALGLAGYLTYTGLKGAHDFMTPTKETFAKTPAEYGYQFEPVTFQSHDGLTLVGWYVPAAVPTDKGIVVFHGHGSNKDTAFKKYGPMLHDHYNLFVYDQRYCGQSQGQYTTLGFLEDKDAVLAVEQLRARGNTSIGLMGESMGAAVAIDTGATLKDVKAVWADCAFDSLYDAVQPRVAARHYPFSAPVSESIIETVKLKTHCDVVTADPVKWIAQIAPRPVYVVHGQLDDETTPMNGEKLFLAAHEPKTMWRTPLAHHAESWKLYPDEYKSRMSAFFDAAM